MKILTIAIPTYNRRNILEQKLDRLRELLSVSSFGDSAGIMVLDNCSDFPLEALEEKYPDVHFIRNRCNIGMVSNIARCIEYCETEWCWILGDDDRVEDNCIATIASAINNNPNCCMINFKSNLSMWGINDTEKRISQSTCLLGGLDYSNLLLISSNVINTAYFRRYMEKILEMNHNMFHYLNALPQILKQDNTYVCRSKLSIVEWLPPQKGFTTWSRNKFYSNAASFAELFDTYEERRDAYKAMTKRTEEIKTESARNILSKGSAMQLEDMDFSIMKILYSIKYNAKTRLIEAIKLYVLSRWYK
jgi:glycosyltransferase involved in cell wall biosynthesis